jgi:hypothetical protein
MLSRPPWPRISNLGFTGLVTTWPALVYKPIPRSPSWIYTAGFFEAVVDGCNHFVSIRDGLNWVGSARWTAVKFDCWDRAHALISLVALLSYRAGP